MRKVIISHRSPHHGLKSGYSRIADIIDAEIITNENKMLPYTFAKLLSQKLSQSHGYYNSDSINKELALLKNIFTNSSSKTLVHFTNAERDFRFSSMIKGFKTSVKFCGTFHKPPDILYSEFPKTKYLKRYDAAVAVGINQVEFLKNWLDIKNVLYIPHGIDTEFFYPSIKRPNQKSIVVVGQHLRDFNTLNKVLSIALDKFPDIAIHIVVHEAYKKKIALHKNIIFHHSLSDTELRALYQKSTILLLPLLDVTACNSLLEGLACGLPIVTTELQSNQDYLAETKNILVAKEKVDDMVSALEILLRDEELCKQIGQSSRKKSLLYSWSNISSKHEKFYKTVFD